MVFVSTVNFLILLTLSHAMTMKQIRNTGKMMRKSCQPKNNVEDEKIEHINDGVFIEEKEVKCYVACIMKMASAIKNGKMNYESALKQADLLLPEDMKEPAKEAIIACKKEGDAHKDICESAFYMTKCMYNHNPKEINDRTFHKIKIRRQAYFSMVGTQLLVTKGDKHNKPECSFIFGLKKT